MKHTHIDFKAQITPFMFHFFSKVENNLKSKLLLPIYIDSSHDSLIFPLLQALQIPKKYLYYPPFSSRIVFEVWETSDSNNINDLLIRILYNGVDITCESQLCSNSCSNLKNQFCQFTDFKHSFLQGLSPNDFWDHFINNQC